jgi:lysophospholipase L1-like esterase
VLGAEVMLARRVERLTPFAREQLDGPIGEGSSEALRLVWLGDSTGDGVGASSPSRVLPRVVAEGLDRPVQLSVLAVSGARVSDVVSSQLPALTALQPEWVIVGVGSNDVSHVTNRRRFRASLDRLLAGIKAAGAERIVLLGVGEFAATPLLAQPLRAVAGLRADQLNGDIRLVAERHEALFVDIIARTGDRFVSDPKRYHASDRYHPSDEGYALWAQATLDAIRQAGW